MISWKEQACTYNNNNNKTTWYCDAFCYHLLQSKPEKVIQSEIDFMKFKSRILKVNLVKTQNNFTNLILSKVHVTIMQESEQVNLFFFTEELND